MFSDDLSIVAFPDNEKKLYEVDKILRIRQVCRVGEFIQ